MRLPSISARCGLAGRVAHADADRRVTVRDVVPDDLEVVADHEDPRLALHGGGIAGFGEAVVPVEPQARDRDPRALEVEQADERRRRAARRRGDGHVTRRDHVLHAGRPERLPRCEATDIARLQTREQLGGGAPRRGGGAGRRVAPARRGEAGAGRGGARRLALAQLHHGQQPESERCDRHGQHGSVLSNAHVEERAPSVACTVCQRGEERASARGAADVDGALRAPDDLAALPRTLTGRRPSGSS